MAAAGIDWDGRGKGLLSPLMSFTKMGMLSASASWSEELERMEPNDEDRDERMMMIVRAPC